jgi:hypothetical protein
MNTKIIGPSTMTENKITLPDSLKNILTQPDYVEDGMNSYWNRNNDFIKTWLGAHLEGNKTTYQKLASSGIQKAFSTNLDNPSKGLGTFRSGLRHPLGYSALPAFIAKSLGFQLWSESALRLRQTITNHRATGCLTKFLPDSGHGAIISDHLTGTTASGVCIFKTYRDSNWDLGYILNEWLPDSLINHLTVLIRQEEHQEDKVTGKKGIPRGDIFSLEEKLNGLHYKEAGITLPLKVTNERAEEIVSKSIVYNNITNNNITNRFF